MVYTIAEFLTAAQKARAVAGAYTSGCGTRTADGYCPLGLALLHPHRAPTRAWITAWDQGRIPDLAAALGVRDD